MRIPVARRAIAVAGLVAVPAMPALLQDGLAAGPGAAHGPANAIALADRFIHWCVAHWGCPRPIADGPIVPCNVSRLDARGRP